MQELNMSNVINDSFIAYAGAVLQSRALIDVRDCIKPSARQIFYCLYTDKFLPNKDFKKVVKALGSAFRMYIHGDSSAEGVMMRASQDFCMRYPLTEVEGNNGNLMMSGNWAAPRYIGIRLTPACVSMFSSLEKETIDEWRDNYDDTEKYPAVLPSKGFYNIVNGTLGLGVGMMSSIPQFNLVDVNEAMKKLLINPDTPYDEIYCCPDFATGGYLINEPEVKEMLKVGRGGSCKLRAVINYKEKDNCLEVTEIPYGIYTNTICEELEKIIEENEIPEIERFLDLTGEKPLIKIYLKKECNYNKVIKLLYKKTSLQNFYTINMTMLENGRFPKVYGWREALLAHIAHEKDVYIKEYEYELRKIAKRINIIEGLLICLASIDEVIALIKGSASSKEAKAKLIERYKLNEEQATAVLAMKLGNLAKLEIEDLKKEKVELEAKAAEIQKILNNEELLNKEIIAGWDSFIQKYGDKRRTKCITIEDEKEEESIPEPEDIVITISTNNKIKRTASDKIKRQNRNTKGATTNTEVPLIALKTNTIDILYLFSDKGKMYSLSAALLEDSDSFVHFSRYITLGDDETIIAVTARGRENTDKYVIFFTKDGYLKKTKVDEYKLAKKKVGQQAIKLEDGDQIINVMFANDDEEVFVATEKGMGIRFSLDEVNPIGRIARGVASIKLNENDKVMTGMLLDAAKPYLLMISDKGNAKKVSVSDFPVQKRAGKGLMITKEEKIVAVINSNGSENVMINSGLRSICIAVNTIPEQSRMSIGVRTIKDGKVTSAAIVK